MGIAVRAGRRDEVAGFGISEQQTPPGRRVDSIMVGGLGEALLICHEFKDSFTTTD